MAVVSENTEYYLIHCMGLNKKQIKEMLPSEVRSHCEKVTREEIKNRGIYNPDEKSKKLDKRSETD